MTETKIEVGMGVTEYVGSDRYPYTVVEILSPKRIVVQRDNFRRTDNRGFSEQQDYVYEPDPNGSRYTITLRKNGLWYKVGEQMYRGGGFWVGERRAYQDPSF